MQNAAGDGSEIRSDDHAYRLVVSDLVFLLGHVQASLKLIELAVAGEASPGNHYAAPNVIVLDDVTPRYAQADSLVAELADGRVINVSYRPTQNGS
jgi:hypothetical protein